MQPQTEAAAATASTPRRAPVISKRTPSIGAEVRGIDLSALDERGFAVVYQAWLEHTVLLFRDQTLTDADLVSFGRRFGELDPAPLDEYGRMFVQGYPEICVISNVVEKGQPIGSLGAAESAWHNDMTYFPKPPKMCSLYALEVPASGGDTGFLSTYRAFETLPTNLRRRVLNLTIKHDAAHNSAGGRRKGFDPVVDVTVSPGAVHPMVITNPDSGRQALYLGRRPYAYVPGLPVEESEALLNTLWAHVEQQPNWHHQWRAGDLLMWDNRACLHRRDGFPAEARRVMHRVQINGGVPVA